MLHKVGIFRHGDELAEAVRDLHELVEQTDCAVLKSKAPGMNPELTFALRLKGMLKLALCVASGALAREESRGAHHRSDFPKRDDHKWLNRTLARWSPGDDEPTLSYEPVGLIDLPPGSRGYGGAESIDMSISIGEHNDAVIQGQMAAGRRDTHDPMGSRLRPGEWSDAQHGLENQ